MVEDAFVTRGEVGLGNQIGGEGVDGEVGGALDLPGDLQEGGDR